MSDCYWFDPEKGCCNTELYIPIADDVFTDTRHSCIGFSKCSSYKPREIMNDAYKIYMGPSSDTIINKIIKKNDPVNHPNHYTQGGIECIDAIRAALGPDGFQASCAANVIKYVWRYRDKNGIEDLKKAQVYLGWLIESIEEEVNGER